jgi:hypothetical protein
VYPFSSDPTCARRRSQRPPGTVAGGLGGCVDLARPTLFSLMVIVFAIVMKWELRRRVWFWAAMGAIAALGGWPTFDSCCWYQSHRGCPTFRGLRKVGTANSIPCSFVPTESEYFREQSRSSGSHWPFDTIVTVPTLRKARRVGQPHDWSCKRGTAPRCDNHLRLWAAFGPRRAGSLSCCCTGRAGRMGS